MSKATSADWEKLRKPFEASEIELLPKYTGKKDANNRIPKDAYKRCEECGGWHPFPCVHLNYVGHAGITNRLLDVDPEWTWEPAAVDEKGLPIMTHGGMWIKLTVLGVTRWGFGDAQGKTGPDATKEIIGDAIRNAAMRFGVATYLWSKSEKAKQTAADGADPETEDPTQAAKARLWGAMKEYCKRKGINQDAELAELGGKEFIASQSVEWLNAKTDFYEAN